MLSTETQRYFYVPKQEIVDKGYELSFNRYHEKVYKEITYRPTAEILVELKTKQSQITSWIEELENML